MPQSNASPDLVVSFGDYRLLVHQRQLLRAGRALDIGDRAFDLLVALVQSRGQAVAKEELMRQAWPGRSVGENALQAQITALRRVFGADRGLIVTVSGRGYHFAGQLQHDSLALAADSPPLALPERTLVLAGRERDLDDLARLTRRERLVTLVGMGGIGKTQLGIELARRLAPQFAGRIQIVDLTEAGSRDSVRDSLAEVAADNPRLLVVDGCERWIELAAELTESALRMNRALRVVATSREPLRAEGESTYRLSPLGLPARDGHDVDAMATAPAVQMFLARLAAAGGPVEADAAGVHAASRICRALDGIPLAIEMAAVRAARVGVEWVIAHLDRPLAWLTHGSRTAPPRHRSMQSALDGSVESLSAAERWVLKRLSEFSAPFNLEQACALLRPDRIDAADVLDRLSSLVGKSLVERLGSAHLVRYRLFQITRAYVQDMP